MATTSTLPTACAGTTAVQVLVELQLTDVDRAVPNLNFVASFPTARPKPTPEMVTLIALAAVRRVILGLHLMGGLLALATICAMKS
jgi:hypothetical protein